MSFTLTGCEKNEFNKDDGIIDIVCLNFPCYDFARQIAGDLEGINVSMLLKPGVEVHNYEMTPNDLLKIQNSDVLVYVGGESDEWVDEILRNLEDEKLVIALSNFVSVIPEEFKEGMEKEEDEHELYKHDEGRDVAVEYDEHVWTSPKNSALIVRSMIEELSSKYPERSEDFKQKGEEYARKLDDLDSEFRKIVSEGNTKEIIVADRFPLIYFTLEYGLDYYAAFPGCAAESEASGKTISFLIDKIKEDDIKYIFHIEMSNEKLANILTEETGAKSLLFHSAHNVTSSEFEEGVTVESLMRGNLETLKLALMNE
ncbi:MAG: metal ABC transporter substrate-binding protein [Clostridia bacterium]|nr:metal ABC transporter substrate-binding protein [Clostridia bacterium]